MRYLYAIFLLIPLFSAAPVCAEPFRTSLKADLTGNGLIDLAELYESREPGDVDMKIWVRNKDGALVLSSQATSIVWLGSEVQRPEFRLTEHGSLQVVSMNYAIGRNRWEQTLTLAYRNDIFVLAGFTYTWYDSLDLENSGNCDVNTLTGKGVLETGNEVATKTNFTTNAYHGPIEDWDKTWPKECRDAS